MEELYIFFVLPILPLTHSHHSTPIFTMYHYRSTSSSSTYISIKYSRLFPNAQPFWWFNILKLLYATNFSSFMFHWYIGTYPSTLIFFYENYKRIRKQRAGNGMRGGNQKKKMEWTAMMTTASKMMLLKSFLCVLCYR